MADNPAGQFWIDACEERPDIYKVLRGAGAKTLLQSLLEDASHGDIFVLMCRYPSMPEGPPTADALRPATNRFVKSPRSQEKACSECMTRPGALASAAATACPKCCPPNRVP
jgi:hypothetical protein